MSKLTDGEKLFLAANLLSPEQLEAYEEAVGKAEKTEQFAIMFDDLDETTQEAVLRFYELTNPVDGNFNENPLFILETE